MSSVLAAIITKTGRDRPHGSDFVLATYIADPYRIACTVALDDASKIMGFQSLRRAVPGNVYGAPVGWGIIGTHVAPWAGRQGVGSSLFAVTLQAARQGGIAKIDAGIGDQNEPGLRFYEACGFRTYKTERGLIHKVYEVLEDGANTSA